ncbi:malectin domain-containing carbohydrate-binding protein [Kribbella sp. NPDC056861]|uniref:malectin domain-containing carbohydrate-binding protein n=1 Tax=Kribbella sp. NPDC056861 TaxID=3154857 RepID=UPI003418F81C
MSRGRSRAVVLGALMALTFALLGSAAFSASPASAVPAPVQIDLAGAGGSGFLPDSYGNGGGLVDTKPAGRIALDNWGPTVTHPIPADIWHTARYLESSYRVTDLAPGNYQVRLYFEDWYFTRTGQRIFDVAINGTKVLTDFDIIGTAVAKGADGGAVFGVEKFFPVTVDASGVISIDFLRGKENQPQASAIVIVPTD